MLIQLRIYIGKKILSQSKIYIEAKPLESLMGSHHQVHLC